MYINEERFTLLEENLQELGVGHLYEQIREDAIAHVNEYCLDLRSGEFYRFFDRVYIDKLETYYHFDFHCLCDEDDREEENFLTLIYDDYIADEQIPIK